MDELLLCIKSGDAAAFKTVYSFKKGKVLAFFIKKTGSAEDAKDLMQNVFFRLWKYRHTITAHCSADQHLFQIAKQVYIDYYRSAKKRKTLHFDLENNAITDAQSFSADLSFIDKKAVLYHLRSEDTLNQRIFILNKYYGYSYQQIAHLLSMSVKSVDNYINKTLKRLRKKIK